MYTWFQQYFAPSHFKDQPIQITTTRIILLILLAVAVLLLLDDILTSHAANLGSLSVFVMGMLGVTILFSRGFQLLARLLVPPMLLAIITYMIAMNGLGIYDVAMQRFPSVIILSGLLLGKRAPLIFAGVSILLIAGLYHAEINGLMSSELRMFTGYRDLLRISIILGATAGVTHILLNALTSSLEHAQRSEERYRFLADNVVDVIWTMNTQMQLTYISPSIEKLSGWTPQEWLGFQLSDFLTPQSLQKVLQIFTKTMMLAKQAGTDRNYAVIFEAEHYRKDGTTSWVEITGRLLYAPRGEITGIIGVSRDITARKREEEVISASERLLRAIVENAPVRVFWKDTELRYLGCNTAFARDAGHSRPEDLIGKDDFQMGWHEQAELYRADDKRVMNSNTPKLGYEEPQTTPDGHTMWLRTSKVPLHDADGRNLGILGIYEDITEQKQAEEVLALNEKRLRQIIDLVPHFIFAKDSDGRFILVNQAIADAYGTTVQELIGKGDADFVKSEEEVRHFREDDHKVISSGLPKIIPEEQLTDAAGNVRILSTQKIPFTFSGATLPSLIGVSVDITERKHAETQLRDMLREKDVLLREIHHRVKNNLQVISSLLNLQTPLLGTDPDRVLFKESQQRVKTMALIHEKLYRSGDLSRIDVREYITTLVRELVASYQQPTSVIDVVFEVAEVHWEIDTAIPCGLIVNELVSDVLKYAFPDGRGTLTIRLLYDADGRYELSVSDNGCGLPNDFDLDHLDSLGLQLVKGLVEEQLAGELQLQNSPGAGTTWRIIF
jgi:PAS domain S-box-containing protein